MRKLSEDLVVLEGGTMLWRCHATAVRYAEARAVLWNTRQRVHRVGGLWHVGKACRQPVGSEPCS